MRMRDQRELRDLPERARRFGALAGASVAALVTIVMLVAAGALPSAAAPARPSPSATTAPDRPPLPAPAIGRAGTAAVLCAPGANGRLPTEGAGVTSIFGADSPPSESIRSLAWLVLGICAVIFVIVECLLVLAVVRFRRKRGSAERAAPGTGHGASGAAGVAPTGAVGGGEPEPPQLYGSNPIELAWTIVPLLIVFVLGLVTIRTIREVQLTEPPPGSLRVQVIGHQWWWEYRYPDELADGREVVTANELVVPVGRPVWLELESADVIHSWWVPRLAGKTDCVPARTNVTWFQARRAGLYLGQCAEYCGTQHAGMLLRVQAVTPEEFRAWLEHQASPAVVDPSVEDGRNLFAELACLNCHAIEGLSDGLFGPNLSHLASRQTIGSGILPLDRPNLRAWIADPQAVKIGCNMPSLKLEARELDLLTDYLMTLR